MFARSSFSQSVSHTQKESERELFLYYDDFSHTFFCWALRIIHKTQLNSKKSLCSEWVREKKVSETHAFILVAVEIYFLFLRLNSNFMRKLHFLCYFFTFYMCIVHTFLNLDPRESKILALNRYYLNLKNATVTHTIISRDFLFSLHSRSFAINFN